MFIPASQGADESRVYYLGFLGTWTEVELMSYYQECPFTPFIWQKKHQPIITVYEAQANLADHEKIQGTDGNWSTPGQ